MVKSPATMKRSAVGLFVFAVVCVSSAAAREILRVEGPRPVLAAVRMLEARHGWTVCYEDPPYTAMGEVIDRTPATYNGPGRIVEPRGGIIEISYDPPPAGDTIGAVRVLQSVIEDHARRNNAGRFRIRVIDDVVCVVPAQGSIMEIPVTLRRRERMLNQVVEDLVRALSGATGIYFREPVLPRGLANTLVMEAGRERAADLLLRSSKSAGHRFSWALLYHPGSGFELNIVPAQ